MSQHPSQPQPRPEAQIQSESDGPSRSEVHDPKDPYTLLCERCGYIIEGLPKEANCPECAKPIAESLPERRVGTAWQNDPGLRSLWATAVATLFHPVETVRTIRIERASASRLKYVYAFSSAAIAAIGSVLVSIADTIIGSFIPRSNRAIQDILESFDVSLLVACSLGVVSAFAIAWLFTTIEERGLRVISRTRGFRIDADIAQAVCAHGAVGWPAGVVGVSVGFALIDVPLAQGYLLALGAALFGFLFFETFAYLGLRHCKYANRPKPRALDQSSGTA